MKYLKSYEIHLDEYKKPLPKIGQYIIMNSTSTNNNLKMFLENNIGHIVHVIKYNNLTPDIIVEYENVPSEFILYTYEKCGDTFYFTHIEDINHISDDRNELEIILASKKYNL